MALTDHVSMTDQLAISTLTLQHRIPDDWAADPWAEVRPLIDGVDVLKAVHPEGMALGHAALDRSCRELATGGHEGAAQGQHRRAALHCRLLRRSVRHHAPRGDRVIWDAWENTSNVIAVPSDFWFDAAQYEAELVRAAADRSWEEPVDTVARLLHQTLADSGWFERWGCVLTNVSPRREEPDMPDEPHQPRGGRCQLPRGSDVGGACTFLLVRVVHHSRAARGGASTAACGPHYGGRPAEDC